MRCGSEVGAFLGQLPNKRSAPWTQMQHRVQYALSSKGESVAHALHALCELDLATVAHPWKALVPSRWSDVARIAPDCPPRRPLCASDLRQTIHECGN